MITAPKNLLAILPRKTKKILSVVQKAYNCFPECL